MGKYDKRMRMMTAAEIAHAWGIETTTLNVLLAVVLGAALAFIPQTLNWIYDAYQRRKERRLVAKREVLLKAAEGAAYVADVIVSYYLRRTSWGDALKAAPGWMHKVFVVGTDATVKAFMDAHDCANEAIAELELLSYDLSQKELEYDSLARWRESMSEFLKNPKYLEHLPDREQKKFEMMDKIMTSFGRQGVLAEEKKKLQQKLMYRAGMWASKYDGYVTAAMLQVRRELTFKGASKEYWRILAASSERSRAMFEPIAELMKKEHGGETEEETIADAPVSSTQTTETPEGG